jgi:hypothetical protein
MFLLNKELPELSWAKLQASKILCDSLTRILLKLACKKLGSEQKTTNASALPQ